MTGRPGTESPLSTRPPLTFRENIREMWPLRHDYFGVRLMLRGMIRMEHELRRTG